MTLSIRSMLPQPPQRELTDDEVFGAAAPREMTDDEVFGPAPVAQGDGSFVSRPVPTLRERFNLNVEDAFRTGTVIGSGSDRLAQIAAREASGPEMEAAVREQQRLRDMQRDDTVSWRDPRYSVFDRVLQGGAALAGQVAGSMASPESLFTGPISGAASLGRRIFQAGRNQAAINVATDPAIQGTRMSGGLQDEYDPIQTALAAPLGFLIGSGVEAGQNARALAGAFREWRAKSGQADPAAPPTPEEIAQFEASPELQAFMGANGITDPADPRIAVLQDRLAARRAAEAAPIVPGAVADRPTPSGMDEPAIERNRGARGAPGEAARAAIADEAEIDRLRALREGVNEGRVDPAFAPPPVPRASPPGVIAVGPSGQGTPVNPDGTIADVFRSTNEGVRLRGDVSRNLPVPVEQPIPRGMDAGEVARARADMDGGNQGQPADIGTVFVSPEGTAGRRGETLPEQTGLALPSPERASRVPMSDAEAARARAAIDGGNQNRAPGMERAIAPEGRAPRAPDDIEAERQAGEAFRLAERQRQRAGSEVRDTQPAGRPEGTGARQVILDEGFPVEVLERRVERRGDRDVVIARVQRIDPRTGQPVEGGQPYETLASALRSSNYAPEPRRAQDFVEQSQSPRNPEQPRMATDPSITQEPRQTYRATPEDPIDVGDTTVRAPRPEQPEGPGPWRERPRNEEEAIRAFEEAARRAQQQRARGEAPRDEGPRTGDNKTSNTPRGQDKDGRYQTDDRGFVVSDKGGPIRFAEAKQAATWIVKVGQKRSPDQLFDPAVHPTGKGYTVRERGRSEPPPRGKPESGDPTGTPRQLPPPPRQLPQSRPAGERVRAERGRPEPGKPASVQVTESGRGSSKIWTVSTRDINGNRVGTDAVVGSLPEMRRERNRRSVAARKSWRDAAGRTDPFVDDGRPLPHRINEDIEAGILGDGKITPEAVAERYGITEAQAVEMLDGIATRPDANVSKSESGTYTRATFNSERIDENIRWAENEFGIKLDDYADTATFFDDVAARVEARSEAEAAAQYADLADSWSRYADEPVPVRNELDEFDIDTGSRLDNDGAPRVQEEDIPFDPLPATQKVQAAEDAGATPRDRAEGNAPGGRQDASGEGAPGTARDSNPGERAGERGDGQGGRTDQPRAEGAADTGRPDARNEGSGRAGTERTQAGEQGVIPGAEQSARQAQAKRDAEGGLRAKGPQKAADEGLFDTGSRLQGRLYSGGIFDPDAWRVLFDWPKRHADAWAKSINEFRRIMGVRGNADPAGKAFFRTWFYAADSEMRAIADRVKDPKAREALRSFLDQWHARAGDTRGAGGSYDEAVSTRTTARGNDLAKILDGLDEAQMAQAVKMVQANRFPADPNNKAGQAARGLAKFLKEELDYLRKAGVEVGEVRGGYFPRIIDEQEVIRDRAGFVAAATDAYRRHLGMSTKDARAAAEEWLSRILYGDVHSTRMAPGGVAEANFLKGRVLPKEADETLRKFLLQDPRHVLSSYIVQGIRRAEYTRRMGAKGEKWEELVATMRKGGAEDTLSELQSYVATVAGTKPPGVSAGVLNGLSWIRTWTALSLLEKATLSSLAEIIMPAVRAASGDGAFGALKNAGRAVTFTVKDLVSKSDTVAKRRALAEDLGLISSAMDPVMSAARWAGGDLASMKQNYVLDKYFRRTGLERWTAATRTAAVGVGQTFVRRVASELVDRPGLNSALLAELGIPKEKAAGFAAWLKRTEDGMPSIESIRGSEYGDMYRTAITRFVDQSIMRPSAATKPRWASHPLGAVVFQLMGYVAAFQKNVVNRPFNLMRDQDLTKSEKLAAALPPALSMLMLWPLQGLIGEARDAVFGDPTRRQEETLGDKALKALSRSGLAGGLDPVLNMATGAKYGRDFLTSVSGPGIGRVGQGVDAGLSYFSRNTENTNSAERKVAKTFYDMGIEPGINLLLTAAPAGNLLAPVVTQVAGSGAVREAFVSAVAGEKQAGR